MLDPRAQVAARKTFGFEEDHTGILTSQAASEVVNTILNGETRFAPWRGKND
jgi:hypothetical protein